MYLALVIFGELDQTTGGYLYDRQLVKHLESAGDTIDVVSIKDRGYLRNILPEDRKQIINKLLGKNYDAIIFDELCHSALLGVLPTIHHKTCCIGLVHHLRSSEPRSFPSAHLASLIEKQFLANMHGLICNSNTTALSCEDLLKRKSPNIIARPGPITHLADFATEDLENRLSTTRPLNILFLGTVTERKGIHVLLQALEQMIEPVHLTIAGSTLRDPRYADICKSYLAKLKQHHIKMADEVTQTELARLLSVSDILAVPSSYEGFGIAYIEGFSAGLPCIATTEGAPQEFVSHGINGFLVKPGDIDAIRTHLDTLASNPNKLKEMSFAALKSFEIHSNWDDNFSKLRPFLLGRITEFQSVRP